ncbi:MAG: hypothetical protein LCH83_01070 [Proteobacteria bacterium]|nr:hypothetical protein [Pseudomonadota bacterium]
MSEPENIKGKFNTEVKRTAHEIRTIKRGNRLMGMANAHFEKHSGAWINKRYGELITSKAVPAPELTPHGMKASPSQKALSAARNDIFSRHKNRLKGIGEKVTRIIESKANGKELNLDNSKSKTLARDRDTDLGR